MALIDELKASSPAFSTMSNLEIADFIHQTYAPTWGKEDVYNKLGVPLPTNPSSLLKWMPSGLESGIRQSQIGTNLLLNAAGLQGDESTANRVSELQRRQAELAPTGATKAGLDEIKAAGESGDIGDTLAAIATNPRALGRLLLESAGSFIPDLALAGVTGGVAGPAVKALAMRFGVKALAPEAIGLAAKMATQAGTVGAASAKTEYGAEFLESLHDAGVDLTSSSAIKQAFQNEELMAKAREEGLAKGIPVGLFDGISMGLAGRFYGKIAGATIGSKLLGSAAEAGMQGALGMAGEASGQLLQKGQITNVADILLEGILEVATAGPEAAINLRHNSAYQAQLEALNKATSEKAVDSQGNQLALPLQRYDTPAGQLSGPLVDRLIEKMAPKNAKVAEIAKSGIDVDTKRRMALEAIYGPDINQVQINNDTIESSSNGVTQTGEQRRDETATDRVGSRVSDILTADQAERLTDSQPTPVNSIDAAKQESAKKADLNARVYESQKADLDQFEKTLQELGPEALDIPGFAADLFHNRNAVRDYEAEARTRAVDEKRAASTPAQYDTAYPENNPDSTAQSLPETETISPPSEDIPADLWRTTRNFISQLSQEPGKTKDDNVINLGVLQSRVSENLGRPVPLSLIRDTLDRMAQPSANIAPMVRKDPDGRYRRNSGTYNIPGPVGTNERTRPTTTLSPGLVAKDNLNLNPSPTPEGVDPINWFRASHTVAALPTGRALTPRMLALSGIPEAQVPPIMKALIKNEALSRGAVPKRTSTPVAMPNTLSDERTTKLLNDEMTGKSYGC